MASKTWSRGTSSLRASHSHQMASLPTCVPCAISQRQRRKFDRSDYIANEPFKLIHCDLSGPFVPTGDGFRYFAVFSQPHTMDLSVTVEYAESS